MTLAAFAAVALSSQAATITWGLGADVYLMETGSDFASAVLAGTDGAPSVADGAYLALVYVGQGVDSFDIGDITGDSVVDSAPFAVDGDGASYADYDPFSTDTRTTAYSDGASFGVVWFDGNAFSYVYSIDDGSALNQATTVSDMSTRGSGDIYPAMDTNGYGGILTVKPSSEPPPVIPEPSVALMGLLGLGMMLKRRRA